jgi:N-acetylglucosaminyl-diphospho-decaprenol L-rhamnosyltransferase
MRLSIVIVCFGEDLSEMLDEVARQMEDGDEVIVVDNKGTTGGTAGVREHPAVSRVIDHQGNIGFPPAVNLGAAEATGDALLLLNPDAVPQPGCLAAMREPPADWDMWMGVVCLPGGTTINTAGGVSHYLGFSWTGRYGEPVANLPSEPYGTGFASGACLGVWLPVWSELGGFPDHFFLYFDDVDISHRMRLAGRRFGVLPTARVVHDYVFEKGPRKWRNLERNRWATVVRTYPAPLLRLVLPALVAIELPLLVIAARDGWAEMKVRAWGDVLRWLPRARSERTDVQRTARVSPRQFADSLVYGLDSPFFGAVGRSPVVRAALRAYWRLVLRLLPQ